MKAAASEPCQRTTQSLENRTMRGVRPSVLLYSACLMSRPDPDTAAAKLLLREVLMPMSRVRSWSAPCCPRHQSPRRTAAPQQKQRFGHPYPGAPRCSPRKARACHFIRRHSEGSRLRRQGRGSFLCIDGLPWMLIVAALWSLETGVVRTERTQARGNSIVTVSCWMILAATTATGQSKRLR